MTIETVKEYTDYYLLNGTMQVSKYGIGNRHLVEIQEWIGEGNIPENGIVEEQLNQRLNDFAAWRYAKESGGVLWMDGEGNAFVIGSDSGSQGKLAAAKQAADMGLRQDGSVWKCYDVAAQAVVFRPTSNAEIESMAGAVIAHVQKCFDVEASCVSKFNAAATPEEKLAITFDSEWELV